MYEIKIAEIFCRYCKTRTKQVLISDTKFYRNFACLKCGFIHHIHGEVYCDINLEIIGVYEEEKFKKIA
jgi:hypothetical protein